MNKSSAELANAGTGLGLRPVLRDLTDAGWSLLTTAVGFGVGIAAVDGVSAQGALPVVGAALLVFAGDMVLRPVLRRLAALGSAAYALLLGLLAQVIIITGALWLTPHVSTTGVGASLLVLVIATAVMATGRWLVGAEDTSYVLGHLLSRRSRRRAARYGRITSGEPAGLLIVQFDGVSRTVLQRAIDAGLAPTIARWLATGSHTLTGW